MLAEADRLAVAKQSPDSLKAADQALDAARQENDTAGQALAQQSRAKALQDLQRTTEALAAWEAAQQIWARAGDTPEQIRALVQAGLLCVGDKKSEAERLFAQGLAVGKMESPRPAALAQALHDSGVALNEQAQRRTAESYLLAALAMREKQSRESLPVVETLSAIADVVDDIAVDENERKYYLLTRDYASRANEIAKHVAPQSPARVLSLWHLCELYVAFDIYPDVAEYCLEALQVQREIAPGGSLMEARILAKFGQVEEMGAHFAPAEEYLAEAVAMAERLGPESSIHRNSLAMIAALEEEEGDLQGARNHLLRVLSSEEKQQPQPIGITATYINLGSVALDQYDFVAARDYTEKALDLLIKKRPNSAGVPAALGNLAEMFRRQGDLTHALEYARQALAIYARGPDGLDTAGDLNSVGDLLFDDGNFTAAANYYQQALDMAEKLVPGSILVSDSMLGLAKVARAQGNRSLAMEYDLHALQLGKKSCPNSFCMLEILNNLGELAYEQGDLAASESYLRQAVDIREKSLGPAHPDLARSLNDLARTEAVLGRTPDALEMALRAESIGAAHLRVSVRTLAERQALAYESIRASGLDLALTLAERNTPSARAEVFDAMIRSRALVFDELAARHRSAYGSGDPEVTQLASQLSSSRTRLATLVFRGVGDMKPETYHDLLGEARQEKEKAERMLAEKSAAFRQEQARTQLGLKEIAAALPPGSALLSFIRYAKRDLPKPGANKVASKPVPSYAAFVLRAGKQEPDFVPLGTAREIESLLAAWRSDIARQEEPNVSKTAEDTYRRTGAALRRRIWDPLLPALGDAREVFVVPDGALHLVSLPSLPVGSSQYLVETRPLIHYLSTERDLVPEQSRHGEGILVVGNPAFDQAGKLAVASNQSPQGGSVTGTTGTLLRGTRSACGTFQTLHFSPLPASQQEAENIAALWTQSSAGAGTEIMRGSNAQPGNGASLQMTGADASPEAFTQYAPGKRVLHVATHGFFLEGSCESALQRRLDPSKRDESVLPATAENPLLLSGLAFTGANRRSSAKADETDGILTAEEIAGINLEGVDWAVLSACDTGVGEIKVGEGVFGLRRAFQVAGAKTVIMSLWPVEDKTTEQWMGTLYREHFLNGKDTAESVRAASLQILRQRRAKHQSSHPFYWGAFIAAGDWH
jgi:CHAT domain-containing protein/Tfp pilus assembly protein PilF